MASGRRQNKGGILTGIWIATAVAAMVVTVIYLGRLQSMYAALDKNTAPAAQVKPGQESGTDAEGGQIDFEEGAPKDSADKNDTSDASGQKTNNAEAGADVTGHSNVDSGTAGEAAESGQEAGEETAGETDSDSDKPYYYAKLDPSKPIIALSFDDGPSMYTERILAALEKNGVKATFFMVGYNIKSYPERVKMVYDAGCEVASHTLDHENLNKCSEQVIKDQVYGNEDLINTIVPVGQIPLRPPYGNCNETVKKLVERPMFNWSVDSLDWKSRNADSVVAEIKANASDGYIILMHDLYESTAEAAERIIPWLLEEGYQVTCISNMFEARGEATEPGHLYRFVSPAPAASEE